MIPPAVVPEQPAKLAPPALVAPAPYEVSFGRIAGTAAPGTRRVIVSVDGKRLGTKALRGRRFSFTLSLPRRDVRIRVTGIDARGNRAIASVGPVFGLPVRAAPRAARAHEDAALAARARALARSFPGVAAAYVLDLGTGAGAAWNARARFPAASTLKLAIAVEVLRALPRPPAPGSRLFGLLRRMLVESDNKAANELEIWLAGSTSGGSALVNRMMRAVGLLDSEMYGGYLVEPVAAAEIFSHHPAPIGVTHPIPLKVERQPAFGRGKHTTAHDMARLARLLHLAAGGRGALLHRLRGFSPADARTILYFLAHAADRGKLDRFLGARASVLHKAGWITEARHDAGLVYWPGGVFVAAVMTWNPAGTGARSDALAGRIAELALRRFRQLRRAGSYHEERGQIA